MKAMIKIYKSMQRIIAYTAIVIALSAGPFNASAGGPEKIFQAVVSLTYESRARDKSDTIDMNNVYRILAAKVNELSKKKKLSIQFPATGTNDAAGHDLYMDFTVRFNADVTQSGVDVYYSGENDFAFQSIKYANMVVSEINHPG